MLKKIISGTKIGYIHWAHTVNGPDWAQFLILSLLQFSKTIFIII